MGTLWFWIVAFMLAAYVILDGFDLGVGAVYLFVARTDQERRQALRSIGPVWDGNEVWLLAAGGTLFFAFPLLYATSFSGFYLPLMIVLWLLMLRGISIELRSHFDDSLWKSLFDFVFSASSILLAIFFGAALANVVRGVPIGSDNYFFLPLWTNWRPGPSPGILDWYTVLAGVLALTALAMHGALYLALRTSGEVEVRAYNLASKLSVAVLILTALSVPATVLARPGSLQQYTAHPAAFLAPVAVLASFLSIFVSLSRGAQLSAFLASCVYLGGMLVGAAAGLFPVLLPSVGPDGHDITIANALAGEHTLHVGLVWWTFGTLLAIGYSITVFWLFRGKIPRNASDYGH